MKCPQCQHENPIDAGFCDECGSRLETTCPACGEASRAGAKFCRKCGQALTQRGGSGQSSARFASPGAYTPKHLAERILTSKAALEGERKHVTVLFADLKGSMELLADRDPEEARKILDPVLERMMEAVHHYEGTVNQVMGDGIMALFGAPLAHEDHGVRACYAALRMQESVQRYAEEMRHRHGISVQIRVGLNSGEVVVRAIGSDLHMDYTAVGQTTHLAGRMEQLASPGHTWITAETLRLAQGYVEVTALGPVPVRGLDGPVDVYELIGASAARTRFKVSAARGLTRFVGREAEMEQLRQALSLAKAGHGQLVAVVGEPGVGKSRLFHEFAQSSDTNGWLILESGSVSYGQGTPYFAVSELLRAYFRIESRDEPHAIRTKVENKILRLGLALKGLLPSLLALLDATVSESEWQALDPPERRQLILESVTVLFLWETDVQPVLFLFEDLHWFDGESQAVLNELVERLPAVRALLLVNYRPEFEHRWSGKTYYREIHAGPLPPGGVDELLAALLGRDRALEPLTRLLAEGTDGNPFFLEESVRTLVETGALVEDRGVFRLMRRLDAV